MAEGCFIQIHFALFYEFLLESCKRLCDSYSILLGVRLCCQSSHQPSYNERDGLILIRRHHHKIQIIEHFTIVLLPSNISLIGNLTMHFIIYRFNGGTLLCSRWLFEWVCLTFYGSSASKFTWNFIYMAESSRKTGKYNCIFFNNKSIDAFIQNCGLHTYRTYRLIPYVFGMFVADDMNYSTCNWLRTSETIHRRLRLWCVVSATILSFCALNYPWHRCRTRHICTSLPSKRQIF